MTGKHASDEPGTTLSRPDLREPRSASPDEMPDPDNLRIDLSTLPFTGPITLPKR